MQYLHAILRRSLGQAEKWELVGRNVAKLVDAPRPARKEVKPFTPEQARQFLGAAKGDRLEALYSVAVSLGLRRGEALALTWADIDLDRRTLTVRRSLQRVGKKVVFTEPKTERSRRTIGWPAVAISTLREHRVRQLEERLVVGARWQDHDLVFPSTIGTPMEPRNVLRAFHALSKRIGVEPQPFHHLRHCAASLLLAQGLKAQTVMAVLGHDRIGTTVDIYGHLFMESKMEAADAMDRALGLG